MAGSAGHVLGHRTAGFQVKVFRHTAGISLAARGLWWPLFVLPPRVVLFNVELDIPLWLVVGVPYPG